MSLVRLADYSPAPFVLDRTDLTVQIFEDHSLVAASLQCRPNPAGTPGPMQLCGEGLELLELRLDGAPLAPDAYRLEPGALVLLAPPQRPFQLDSLVRIHPETNSSLEGL